VRINVTLQSHLNRYWSLRGGGCKFGVITSFQLHTFALNIRWGSDKVMYNSDYENALDASHSSGAIDAVKDDRGSSVISLGYWEGYGPLAQALMACIEPTTTR
jgi:hypothetical protein